MDKSKQARLLAIAELKWLAAQQELRGISGRAAAQSRQISGHDRLVAEQKQHWPTAVQPATGEAASLWLNWAREERAGMMLALAKLKSERSASLDRASRDFGRLAALEKLRRAL